MNIEKLHMLQPIHFNLPAAVYTHYPEPIHPHPDVGYATQIAIQIRAFTETKITFFLWIDATLK